MNGGALVASVLEAHGVRFVFTLCGGHISPILVECKRRGLKVVDTRHEVNAVFAADAVARLTGTPGVAAVTAGPGVTNTVTAVKNAQLAQSPVVLLGGATATVLKGRGALQDIDQMALMAPHVKWCESVGRLREIPGALSRALAAAQEGVPGPVFLECPVDLLYEEEVVKGWYGAKSSATHRRRSLSERAVGAYLQWHVSRVFGGVAGDVPAPLGVDVPVPTPAEIGRIAKRVAVAQRPVLLMGSQAMLEPRDVGELVRAVERLEIPTYLAGMARGLLGAGHPLQLRHQRRRALQEADLVLLAGVPSDFRLDYGRHFGRRTVIISCNRSREDLLQNRRPNVAVQADPGRCLRLLSQTIAGDGERWREWRDSLRQRDEERAEEILRYAGSETERVNPLALCREIEAALPDDTVLVADGGDFVATASYIVSPRRPLSWLDPGVFGTLGVGAGFALGAKLCRPQSEVWILYGDGSAGYSLAELDTFVRHRLPVIAVVGNDACWMQIAREQVTLLDDDVGCGLRRTDYHQVARGFGAKGLLLDRPDGIEETLAEARQLASEGHPVLINAHLGTTDFRQGSISI